MTNAQVPSDAQHAPPGGQGFGSQVGPPFQVLGAVQLLGHIKTQVPLVIQHAPGGPGQVTLPGVSNPSEP